MTIYRNIIVITILGFSSFHLRAENLIRQTLLKSGTQYDLYTDNDSGSGLSNHPMEEGGISYELYSRGSAWDTTFYFLDRKLAGFYLPQATITMESEDWTGDWFSNSVIQRTRADKPYKVAIKVWGLTPDDPLAPAAARQVLYTQTGQNFQSTYVPDGNPEYVLASYLMGNSDPVLTPVYTLLTPMAPTKAMGIERFTISTLTDETVTVSSILQEKMILVWPVSEAIIEGIEPGFEIRDSLPNIVVHYKDLYPLSLTYMHIYKGGENLGTVGTIVPTSLRFHNTIVPQNEIISLENWENLIPEDGTYTIEVLSVTPFDNWEPERMAHVTFSVNRKLKLNGSVVTSEK